MAGSTIPLEVLLERLEKLVTKSLKLWDLPSDAKARLINVSENATYLIEASGGYKSVLRVHRENYHSKSAIACELAWIAELRTSKTVSTPNCIAGKNGQAIQTATSSDLPEERYMVLFEFVDGVSPDEEGDLVEHFVKLGEIAARTHKQSSDWSEASSLERKSWDLNAIFGNQPTWGDWRDAPQVTDQVRKTLERVEDRIEERLTEYGKSNNRFGLIHADMRLANLLVDGTVTNVIDFDDCGFGWYLYDFATGISFMEDDPRVPNLKSAWLRGYQKVRKLSSKDLDEVDTFVMLRRMALLAWIGSHIEAPEPQALADGFAETTAQLGLTYLNSGK